MSFNVSPSGLFPFTRMAMHYNKVRSTNPYFRISNPSSNLKYLEGEVLEVKEAIQDKHSKAHIEEEAGDVLMTASVLCYSMGIDPNAAMLKSKKKVQDRLAFANDLNPKNINQFQKAWEKAKQTIG